MSLRFHLRVATAILAGAINYPARAENCFRYLSNDAAFDACSDKQDEARIGKYFCYVVRSVGIQYPRDREGNTDTQRIPYSGDIRPAKDKFFINIRRNIPEKSLLCVPGKPTDMSCTDKSAPFAMEIKSDELPAVMYGYNSIIFRSHQHSVTISLDLRFVAFGGYDNSFVFHGMCEKIS